MSKQRLAQKFVADNRRKGKTDTEIYDDLIRLGEDEKSATQIITNTLTDHKREKYSIPNTILMILLGLLAVFHVIRIIDDYLETKTLITLIYLFAFPLISTFFAYEVAKYNAIIYRICGVITLLIFLHLVPEFSGTIRLPVNLIFSGSVVALSFYLHSKMFPGFKPKRRKKKEGKQNG